MSSMKINQNIRKESVEWRRSKVQELLVKGYNHYEIADTLHISRPTITKDMQYLRQQAQENLHKHIRERLPEEYQNCLTGINRILRLTLDIAEKPTTTDDKTRLQALALANECYKSKLDLTTDGVVVTDAINIFKNKLDHSDSSEERSQDPKENRIKENDEESQLQHKKKTNGIF
jgi:predicted transcriptional regulator